MHNFKINLSRLNNYDKRIGNDSVKDYKRKLMGKYMSKICDPNGLFKFIMFNTIYLNTEILSILILSIAHRVYEDVPLTLPGNAILFNTGEGLRLKLQDSNDINSHRNKTEDDSFEQLESSSNDYFTVNLNRQRWVV